MNNKRAIRTRFPNNEYLRVKQVGEFIDLDFEWIYDSSKRRIMLKLPETLSPENLEVVIPCSEGLISIKDNEKPIC